MDVLFKALNLATLCNKAHNVKAVIVVCIFYKLNQAVICSAYAKVCTFAV